MAGRVYVEAQFSRVLCEVRRAVSRLDYSIKQCMNLTNMFDASRQNANTDQSKRTDGVRPYFYRNDRQRKYDINRADVEKEYGCYEVASVTHDAIIFNCNPRPLNKSHDSKSRLDSALNDSVYGSPNPGHKQHDRGQTCSHGQNGRSANKSYKGQVMLKGLKHNHDNDSYRFRSDRLRKLGYNRNIRWQNLRNSNIINNSDQWQKEREECKVDDGGKQSINIDEDRMPELCAELQTREQIARHCDTLSAETDTESLADSVDVYRQNERGGAYTGIPTSSYCAGHGSISGSDEVDIELSSERSARDESDISEFSDASYQSTRDESDMSDLSEASYQPTRAAVKRRLNNGAEREIDRLRKKQAASSDEDNVPIFERQKRRAEKDEEESIDDQELVSSSMSEEEGAWENTGDYETDQEMRESIAKKRERGERSSSEGDFDPPRKRLELRENAVTVHRKTKSRLDMHRGEQKIGICGVNVTLQKVNEDVHLQKHREVSETDDYRAVYECDAVKEVPPEDEQRNEVEPVGDSRFARACQVILGLWAVYRLTGTFHKTHSPLHTFGYLLSKWYPYFIKAGCLDERTHV